MQNSVLSLNVAAIGATILLLVGIRNTWDLTIWIAQNQREKS